MGGSWSCTSKGAALIMAASNGDITMAQELLKIDPRAAVYHNFNDKSSPLIQASARGHFELVQLVLETAVMTEGPDRAKRLCIDHCNSKRQSALMVACKHGHPDCVEYLVTNGADPLMSDERRHNTCLHFAALYGHSDCVDKLLGSRTVCLQLQGRQLPVARLPCADDDGSPISFIDRHNGWGLTALHIAVFQGSVNTVRALLRHGASLDSVITPAKIENSPIRCAVGSNALHIAALIGNISMAKIILEAQDSVSGMELRNKTDAAGLKPGEYAQRARNTVLVHLLDERLPVSLLRQIWMNYSLEQSMPPRHQTLGAMLQKLKLMFNLEIIAVQRNLAASSEEDVPAGGLSVAGRSSSSSKRPLLMDSSQQQRASWTKRLDEVQVLLNSVTQLHATLLGLCRKAEEGPQWSAGTNSSHEAVLDFILSTLITPRTVSAIVHAAKKLVCSNVMAVVTATPAGTPPPLPPSEIEVQHGIALLTTALRAVDTCLQAVSHLSNPSKLSAAPQVQAAAQNGPPSPPTHQSSGTSPSTIAAAPVPSALASGAPSQSAATLPHQPAGSSSPDSSFTAATAHGTIGTRVPSVTSTTATEMTLLQADPLQTQTLGTGQASLQASAPSAPALTNAPSPGLMIQPQGRAAAPAAGSPGTPLGAPLFSAHWSAQLHSLIAQLHWDIGVQRHRRRRQHAAQQAARAAGAGPEAVVAAGAGTATADALIADALSLLPGRPNPPVSPPAVAVPVPQGRRSRRHASSRDLPLASDTRRGASSSLIASQDSSASLPASIAPTGSGTAASPVPAVATRSTPHDVLLLDQQSMGSTTPLDTMHAVLVDDVAEGASGPGLAPSPEILPRPGTAPSISDMSCSAVEILPTAGPTSRPASARRVPPAEHVLMIGVGALGDLSEDLSGAEEDAGSIWSDDDSLLCSICMDQPVAVQVTGCQHGLCVQCAFQLTIKGRELPSCPFCRQKIPAFEARPAEGANAGGGHAGAGGGHGAASSKDLMSISNRSKGAAGTTSSKAVSQLTRLSN